MWVEHVFFFFFFLSIGGDLSTFCHKGNYLKAVEHWTNNDQMENFDCLTLEQSRSESLLTERIFEKAEKWDDKNRISNEEFPNATTLYDNTYAGNSIAVAFLL